MPRAIKHIDTITIDGQPIEFERGKAFRFRIHGASFTCRQNVDESLPDFEKRVQEHVAAQSEPLAVRRSSRSTHFILCLTLAQGSANACMHTPLA